MDLDATLRAPLSRRRLLGLSAGGAGTAVLLAGCGEDMPPEALREEGAAAADVDILNAALNLEHMAVAAYTAAVEVLHGAARQAGRDFLGQEEEHAGALAQAIRDLGGRPNRPRSSYDLPGLRSQEDALRFAVDVENTAVAAYIDALPKLSAADLRRTAASIVTNEAEHIAVLRTALGEEPVQGAFVVGER